MMKCYLCSNPANLDVELRILIGNRSRASVRKWGGPPGRGYICLCDECAWRLESLAGEAVAAAIKEVQNARRS